ncbi:hypothetical protein PILCRDRAFT_191562 [Piloderma croceum F 1598]|uniref:Uncharacterized protein n=1 Tax=Piloderma croceum (strain F 1598) TaxID=765440 RepID=A0A0C3GD55_PILCF|nr:hypothetical protein PILCRDRAFT_191562 [Piloderma croceum F 1598]
MLQFDRSASLRLYVRSSLWIRHDQCLPTAINRYSLCSTTRTGPPCMQIRHSLTCTQIFRPIRKTLERKTKRPFSTATTDE